MLSLVDIIEYLNSELKGGEVKDGNRRCLKEGEAIVDSRHIIFCGVQSNEEKENEAEARCSVKIMALCLQTSKMSGPPHQIHVRICEKGEQKVKEATCSCKAGQSGQCKHIAGVLLYIYR